MNKTTHIEKPPWVSIAILSMLALAYEILLMRLFSIIQWHHFAYMIISLALLGYGASGTFLALNRHYLLSRYTSVYLSNILLFALSSLFCFLLAQEIQFNAEEMFWDYTQVIKLVSVYLLLALPFFFVANAVGLSLVRFQNKISVIYAADLIGAGTGSVLIIILLFTLLPADILRYICLFALLTASIELLRHKYKFNGALIVVFLLIILTTLLFTKPVTELKLSPYKGLSQQLRISGNQLISQDSSPLGLISLVKNTAIPLRHAPGLSLNASTEPPEQLAIFIDGDSMTAITNYSGERESITFLDQLTSALPYHLSTIEHSLVLAAGGGMEVLQAQYHQVKQISAIELDKQIIRLIKDDYNQYSGRVYTADNVEVFAEEARGFMAGKQKLYDLVQLAMGDSFSVSSAGLHALNENYLYTVEAFQSYLANINHNGYLSITRWIKLPPRDSLKLFATAIEALRKKGVADPGQHLVLIRGLQTSTLLVKNSPVSKAEIIALQQFCAQRSFDIAYYPGMRIEQANQYNRLAQPVFYKAAISLLSEQSKRFIQQYKFNIEAATDNQPYFYHFFKWSVLPEIINLKGQGGVSLLAMGYLILLATLLQVLLLSVLIIIIPLIVFKRKNLMAKKHLPLKAFMYFLCLGLSFLFLEISLMQKFIIYLEHPIYAISVVLAVFLIFAGLGSFWARRYMLNKQYAQAVKQSVFIIFIIGILYIFLLNSVFSYLVDLSIILKIILSTLLIAPLAFYMGMPFPLGLSRLAEHSQTLVPWAWGVNGCASVLSAVLATLLAIQFGFTFVILSALILYALAAISAMSWLRY